MCVKLSHEQQSYSSINRTPNGDQIEGMKGLDSGMFFKCKTVHEDIVGRWLKNGAN